MGWSVGKSRHMSAILVGSCRWLHFCRLVPTMWYRQTVFTADIYVFGFYLLFRIFLVTSADCPVSQPLHLSIDAFTDTPPATDWKRPPGRPWRTWKMEEDMGLPISACQFATLDRSLWRSLRPSAGQVQQ